MKLRSQDEINTNIKFIFGNTNQGVYKIMSRWIKSYEENERINQLNTN